MCEETAKRLGGPNASTSSLVVPEDGCQEGLSPELGLYGVENEKIVKLWGFPEMAPPEAEWKNNNGMLQPNATAPVPA